MRRKASIPYGETTILSLLNMTAGNKFQLIAKIKDISSRKVTIHDDHEEIDFIISKDEVSDLKVGDVIFLFGKKDETGIQKDCIIKSSLDWDLYLKTRDLESR